MLILLLLTTIIIIALLLFIIKKTAIDGSCKKIHADPLNNNNNNQLGGSKETAGQKFDAMAGKLGENLGKQADLAGDYIHDSVITALIKVEFLTDISLKSFQINVVTTNGSVHLSGVLDSQQSVDKCLEIVRLVHGVKSVKSDLFVKRSE